MRYSIVVPVCNSGDYLLRFMHPFLKYQGDYEGVFVDDGSDDDSLKRCERLKKRFPAIQIVRQEKKGVLAARLRGLEESTGEVISLKIVCMLEESVGLVAIAEVGR